MLRLIRFSRPGRISSRGEVMPIDPAFRERLLNPDLSALKSYPAPEGPGQLDVPAEIFSSRAELSPHFDLVRISWSEFLQIVRHKDGPSTRLFSKDLDIGLRGPPKSLTRSGGWRMSLGLEYSCASQPRSRRDARSSSGVAQDSFLYFSPRPQRLKDKWMQWTCHTARMICLQQRFRFLTPIASTFQSTRTCGLAIISRSPGEAAFGLM